MGKLNPKNKVDLTNPELTIIVEVIKAVCCVSVVKDYTLFRKYNVQEVVKEDAPKAHVTSEKRDAQETEQNEKKDAAETCQEEKNDEDGDKNMPETKKGVDAVEGEGE